MQKIMAACDDTTVASLQEVFGFVPNLFYAQTSLPRVIEPGAGIVRAVLLDKPALSRTRKGLILLAAATAYRNTYCVCTAYRMLQSLGVAKPQLDQIVTGSLQAGLAAPDSVLLEFALKLATCAPWISERDINALRGCGFVDAAILEAILVTALANFLCTLSVALAPAPDFEHQHVPWFRSVPPPDKRSYVGGISGPYLERVELSSDSFLPFAFFLGRFGFVPNIFRAQTLRPDVIEAEAELVRSVIEPADLLSHFQKECILLVGSAVNLNTYCVAVHCEMLRAMGASAEQSDQIAVDHHQAQLSEANKALLDFALKLTARPLEFLPGDIEALRTHGFTNQHILEAVVVTALNNFFNTLQMGLGTTPDLAPIRVFEPKEVHSPVAAEHLIEAARVDPDAEFVIRVQNGDLDAFEELVTRHNRRVYRVLMAITGKHEDARDATQETFLKAFEHIGDFQQRSQFSTWLLSIARNTGLQYLRERKDLDCAEDLEDGEFRPRHIGTWHADPEQLYSLAERRKLVERGLMKMPRKYRVVLVLRDIEQLSTDEAAVALGLGIPALKARLFRARMMLREALSSHFATSREGMGL